MKLHLFTLLAAASLSLSLRAQNIQLAYPHDVPLLEFAASEIRAALEAKGHRSQEVELAGLARAGKNSRIILLPSPAAAAKFGLDETRMPREVESYAIVKHGQPVTYLVAGADPVGAMYGGLDVAEAIRLGTLEKLREGLRAPFIERRGIKFNIPLDARTPSYSDMGDMGQANIPEMWRMDFWREFIDEMARNRYDTLSIWNLHPFPSMVKVPDYPDVALDDVMRTRAEMSLYFDANGMNYTDDFVLADLETVKTMTIAEKIAFWREVMQYAHDRGVDFYIFTWNIFVHGAKGRHGITDKQDDPKTIDYFRKSVTQMLRTYPLLKAIGITSGEHMHDEVGGYTREDWLRAAYGQGMIDFQKLDPTRSVTLIHRVHQADLDEIDRIWKSFPYPIQFSTKQSIAHMYSSVDPPFSKDLVQSLKPGQRTWLEVRNDDIYNFRWADPDYARAYLRNLPGPDKLAGFFLGSDGWIWGREYNRAVLDDPPMLFVKKGPSFMLWGRLAYDPDLTNEWFRQVLAARFPEVDAEELFEIYTAASRIIPQVNRFFWIGGGNDLRWQVEGCMRRPDHKDEPGGRIFYTVQDFMDGEPMNDTKIVRIKTYCEKTLENESMDDQTPPEVADALEKDARTTLDQIAKMPPVKDEELLRTFADLATMAHLGNYYAEKIRGATDLEFYRKTGKVSHQKSAVTHLQKALGHWKSYAAAARAQYRPQFLPRQGMLDVTATIPKVEEDIEIARQLKPE